jgi:hypothetical protein
MAREQDRHVPFPDEGAEEVEDLGDAERIDRGRRLVEDQDVRILDQGVGDAEALKHAARVRLGEVIAAGGEPDLVEDLVDRRLCLGARDPVERRGVAQVLAAGQVAVEADGVRQVADAPLDLERPAGRIQPDDAGLALSVGSARAASGSSSSCRAVLAEQPEDLAALDLEIEVSTATRSPYILVRLRVRIGARGGRRPARRRAGARPIRCRPATDPVGPAASTVPCHRRP